MATRDVIEDRIVAIDNWLGKAGFDAGESNDLIVANRELIERMIAEGKSTAEICYELET
jgi:hypothetical protein